jgi:hypothetical protein
MILTVGLSICVALFLLSRIGQPAMMPMRSRRKKV